MKKKLRHLFSGIGIVLFVFFAFASNNETSEKEDKEELIFRYASDYVKQRLDSPDDAIFPDLSEGLNHIVHINEEEYYINSWVDTPEGKRMNYNCSVIIKKDYIGVQNLEIEYINKSE